MGEATCACSAIHMLALHLLVLQNSCFKLLALPGGCAWRTALGLAPMSLRQLCTAAAAGNTLFGH